ncbi:Alpha/beta hydrolase [Beijerinckiaceae bacterium RH AL1]|nr:alpha/beta fold hydrolase [Beijerinckiaceae bacterium]VVB47856.1 Alpha/beta hydrolase [Beijerinckiaceae bacterium RH CH11]VVB47934.1 Alpha/beta hydrolase [Beijerinckiaceae bacterium RH AL8]VVC56099.1 Alpha/beta hydrolase [Beijerinckiaceae bacterium RH AL1]
MDFPLPTFREPRSPLRRAATWSLIPLGLSAGWLGAAALRVPHDVPLDYPLDAEMAPLQVPFGELATYAAGPEDGVPLLLVHSINAAASAYEMRPLFEHYAKSRPVYALDLPGYGLSDRKDRIYTPRLMTDALIAMIEHIRAKHGTFPIDVVALSLSCEFAARAANDHPTYVRSLGLIAPTGFDSRREVEGPAGETYGNASARDIVSFPAWGRPLFDALTSRVSMRFFLEKTFGSKRIDEGLLDYGWASAHQQDAEHAPFSFLAGFLFSKDALTLYKQLAMPVWMAHGVRGDFVDYKRKSEVEGRPGWTIDVFQTGAMPHFETLDTVTAAYDAFLDTVAG